MKKLIIISVGIISLMVIAIMRSGQSASDAFVERWSKQFKMAGNLKAVKALPQAKLIYIQTFKNGEWVAATCEHACCSGAGYNATVFYDSQRKIYYDTTYSFCGLEGLGGELGKAKATSLQTFYPQLCQLSLNEVK